MSVIYILIPIAIILTAIGIYLFFWAVKTDQFDDLEKQGLSILFDDETDKPSPNKAHTLKESNDDNEKNSSNQLKPDDKK